jgi:hypothetical protein
LKSFYACSLRLEQDKIKAKEKEIGLRLYNVKQPLSNETCRCVLNEVDRQGRYDFVIKTGGKRTDKCTREIVLICLVVCIGYFCGTSKAFAMADQSTKIYNSRASCCV